MLGMGREIDLDGVILHPQRRAIEGPSGSVHVEPLVMRFLCTLARSAGRVVDRHALFDACWAGSAMGDDSLNRLAAGARRALRSVGGDTLKIETVPGAGYLLSLGRRSHATAESSALAASQAWQAGFNSWRVGLPVPDWLAIERLKRAVAARPSDSACWGMLSLMYRLAAEYSEPAEHAALISQCEHAAGEALALDADQPEAAVALTSIVPIFGNWPNAHDRLTTILARSAGNAIVTHDLVIVEMSTGRVSAAKAMNDRLVAADPLAPSFGYKYTYQHWSVGELVTMDQQADRLMQLWADHPAVWTARFWTLAYTGRAEAAERMCRDEIAPAPLPSRLVRFLNWTLAAAMGDNRSRALVTEHAVSSLAAGPGQAVNSLMALGLIGDVDSAFAVAGAFYTQSGAVPVPIHGDPGLRVNDMKRRLTQVLFTPACAEMRADARFEALCARTGLLAYWNSTGRTPDYLS